MQWAYYLTFYHSSYLILKTTMLYKIDFLILQIKKMSSEMESNLYKGRQEDMDR